MVVSLESLCPWWSRVPLGCSHLVRKRDRLWSTILALSFELILADLWRRNISSTLHIEFESMESDSSSSASRFGGELWREKAEVVGSLGSLNPISEVLMISTCQLRLDRMCHSRLGCFGGGLLSVWVVGSEVEGEVALTWGLDEVEGNSASGMLGMPEVTTFCLYIWWS